MTEQIEFNMDAEYSLRVAAHPELVEIIDAPMCELQEILKEFENDDPGADRCLNSVSITFLRAELTAR